MAVGFLGLQCRKPSQFLHREGLLILLVHLNSCDIQLSVGRPIYYFNFHE